MISITTETTNGSWDYVIDKDDEFKRILHYLKPKLKGTWNIQLVNPKPDLCRELLDTNICPTYINLVIVVPKDLMENLQAERPQLIAKVKTTWEYYQELISQLPNGIEVKAIHLLYNRCVKNKTVLKDTLNLLVSKADGEMITAKLVKAYVVDNSTSYANDIVLSFMEDDRSKWRLLKEFEEYLGTKMAFYTLRKYIRRLMIEKCNYIQNKETKDRNVSKIDAFSLIYIFNEFEKATSPNQLHTILMKVERRHRCYTTVKEG